MATNLGLIDVSKASHPMEAKISCFPMNFIGEIGKAGAVCNLS